MAPKNLLQDTVEYNRKINRTRKMLKSKKSSQYPLPLKLTRPIQSGIPATVPVESVKVLKKGISSTKINNKLHVSKNHRNTKQNCDHVLYTPIAVVKQNYKTVMSLLQPSGIETRWGNIRPKKSNTNLVTNFSDLPTTRYRVTSKFVDELLDSLTTRNRMTKSQSNLKSIPDLSGLSTRRYRLSPSFIDEMLDNLVISKKFLEGYHPSTFVENLLNSL